MEGTLILVAPVFGFALLGFLAVRLRYVSETAVDGLIQFVVSVAVPLLVFRTMARVDLGQVLGDFIGLLLAYFLGVLAVLLLAMAAARVLLKRHNGAQVSLGLAASYSNMVLLGIPAVVLILGANLAVPLMLLVSLQGPVMVAVVTLAVNLPTRQTKGLGGVLLRVLDSQRKTPMFLALALGLIYGIFRLPLPEPVDMPLRLIGAAVAPCGLFALGGLLVRYRLLERLGEAVLTSLLKLAVLPAVVWVLAAKVFSLPGSWVWVAVMLATMPTTFELEARNGARNGSNGKAKAKNGDKQSLEEIPGASVLLSTLLAMATITVLTHIIRTG